MQVAVCCPDAEEVRQICSLIEERAAEAHMDARATGYRSEDALWRDFRPGRFQAAVVGYGDVKGFLCARRLREEDSACRVILLDDTDRYAIRGLRIHLNDYLVRPLEGERLRAAIGRLLTD